MPLFYMKKLGLGMLSHLTFLSG